MRYDDVDTHSLNYLLAHGVIFLIGIVVITIGIPLTQSAIEAESVLRRVTTALVVGIGSSLVAGGVVGWTLFAHDVRAGKEYTTVASKMEEIVNPLYPTVENFPDIINKHGLIQVYQERGPEIKDVYEGKLKDASDQVDIMGFGLSAFREDFEEDFEDWATEFQVRILLIDPVCPSKEYNYADQRDSEEKEARGGIREDVRAFLEQAYKLSEQEDSNLNIRLYTCLPHITVFRIDDEILWGPYTVGNASRNNPTFVVSRSGELFDHFQTDFDQIWENDNLSRAVPEDWETELRIDDREIE